MPPTVKNSKLNNSEHKTVQIYEEPVTTVTSQIAQQSSKTAGGRHSQASITKTQWLPDDVQTKQFTASQLVDCSVNKLDNF